MRELIITATKNYTTISPIIFANVAGNGKVGQGKEEKEDAKEEEKAVFVDEDIVVTNHAGGGMLQRGCWSLGNRTHQPRSSPFL